jgi:hypothetical protein
MCILRFHARAGYLQIYETLLKQLYSLQGSDKEQDQYAVDCVALADRNFNVPCESGIRYPSLIAMMNRRQMMWQKAVMCHNACIYTAMYSVYRAIYSAVHGIHFANMVFVQAHSKHCSGCALLDLNLLKPSRIKFTQDPTPDLTLPDGEGSSPTWLEYVYRTAHPTLRWLPTKTCRMSWGVSTKLIGCLNPVPVGLQQS